MLLCVYMCAMYVYQAFMYKAQIELCTSVSIDKENKMLRDLLNLLFTHMHHAITDSQVHYRTR